MAVVVTGKVITVLMGTELLKVLIGSETVTPP